MPIHKTYINRKFAALLCAAALAGALSGCAAERPRTGEYDAKTDLPKDCGFTLYTSMPKGAYRQLGMISFDASTREKGLATLAAVRKTARAYVCKAGGNGLIVWNPTKDGLYPKATVIWREY